MKNKYIEPFQFKIEPKDRKIEDSPFLEIEEFSLFYDIEIDLPNWFLYDLIIFLTDIAKIILSSPGVESLFF